MNSLKKRLITLLITHQCNLRCIYCYVKDYNNICMSLETAQKIISNEFEHAEQSFEFLEFIFLGGEPFLYFDRIKEISEWMWAKHWNRPYLLSVVTNGTLLNRDSRKWLEKNRDRMGVCLSYDGMELVQNLNRSSSASSIDIAFFLKNWPHQAFKMTISEKSVSYLSDSIIALGERGIRLNAGFAGGVPEWNEDSYEVLQQQMSHLVSYYLENENADPCNLLTIDLLPVLDREKTELPDCGHGKIRVTYDCDGRKYSCHLLSPLVLSQEQIDVYQQRKQESPKKKGICSLCKLNPICPRCEGNAMRITECTDERYFGREKNMCRIFKIQVFYACQYQLKKILKVFHTRELDSAESGCIKAVEYLFQNGRN